MFFERKSDADRLMGKPATENLGGILRNLSSSELVAQRVCSKSGSKARQNSDITNKRKAFFFCTVAVLPWMMVLPSHALAQSTEWTGSASNDWTDAANWSAGVPSSSDEAKIVTSGLTNSPEIGDNVSVQVDKVVINNDNHLTVRDEGLLYATSNIAVGEVGGQAGTLKIGDGGIAGIINTPRIYLNAAASSIIADFTDDLTLSSVISGVGSLYKDGTGTLTLTGMNDYTGSTVINEGTLALSGQGRIPGSSNIEVNGTLDVSAAASVQIKNLSGSGSILLGNTSLMINDAAGTFSGVISGAGGISINSGTQVLTGTNTYTSTGISSGATLQVGDGGTSGSIASNVLNYGTLIFNRSDDTVYSGTITGPGSFEHIGASKLILTATNSTSGNVKIGSNSILQLGNGGTTGLIGGTNFTGTITNDGTLIYNRSNAVTWKGIYAGTGEIVQTGTGTLILTGDSSAFGGSTTVQNGRLLVGNSLGAGKLGGSVSVQNGALLGGSGTIGSSGALVEIGSGATLAAGNSIGHLNIIGNLGFSSGSTFDVEVNDGGNVAGTNNDTTTVDGNITIASGSTVRVRAANGTDDGSTYAPNTSYTILSYTGSRTGMFNSAVDENFAFLDASLSYDPNAVLLNLSRNDLAFSDVANTPNQTAVANAFAGFDPTSDVYQEMIGLSEEQAREAYDSISGEFHAASQYVSYGTFNLFSRMLGSNMVGGRTQIPAPAGGPALGYVASANTMSAAATAISALDQTALAAPSSYWFSPLGGRGSVDGDGNGASYDWKAAGIAAGYETPVMASRGTLTVGFGVGYLASWADNDARLSSSDSHGGYVGLYADWVDGPLSVSGQLAYGLNRVSTSRDIVVGGLTARADADYWSHNLGLGVESAYALSLSDGLTLSPLASLSVSWAGHGSFRESGAGLLNADVSSENNWWMDTGLGVELGRQVQLDDGGKLKVTGRAVWGHRVGSMASDTTITLAGGGGAFQVNAAEADRDRLLVGAGIGYSPNDRTTFSLNYSGEFAGSTDNHTGKIGLKFAF
jgi:outer membrane autotransporter protein